MNQYKKNTELNYYEILIHDKFFNHVGTALIDLEDYDKVKDLNWTLDREGFVIGRTKGGGKQIRLARLILELGECRVRVKYINGNKFDNRKDNLDTGDIKKKLEESEYIGVEGVKKHNKSYQAFITYKQKRNYLGSSKDLYEAIGMRKRAEYQLSLDKGEIPKTNPIQYIPQEGYNLNFDRRTNSTLNECNWNESEKCYEMILYNRENQPICTTLIDAEDYPKIKDYKWGLNAQYAATKMNGHEMKLHRFITNPPDDRVVDHENGDTLDNRKGNLRFLTIRENAINRKTSKHNKTGVTGVFEERGMYHAVLNDYKKRINLGWFNNLQEATIARRQAEYRYGYTELKSRPLIYIPDDLYSEEAINKINNKNN